jgi:ferritin
MQEYIDEQHEKQEQALTLAELVEVAREDAAA